MKRPTGVTILASFSLLAAVAFILCAFGFLAGGKAVQDALEGHEEALGIGAIQVETLVPIIGVTALVLAALHGLVGYGLWGLRNWARILTLVVMGLGTLGQVFAVFGSLIHFEVLAILWNGFWLAIDGLIIWYMLQPGVSAAFSKNASRA